MTMPQLDSGGNLVLTINLCAADENELRTAVGVLLSMLDTKTPTAAELEWQQRLRDKEQAARSVLNLVTQDLLSNVEIKIKTTDPE